MMVMDVKGTPETGDYGKEANSKRNHFVLLL